MRVTPWGRGSGESWGTFQANAGLIRVYENTRGCPQGVGSSPYSSWLRGPRRYPSIKRPRRQAMINAERLLMGLFSAEHLTGQTFNLWLSGAFSPLISQRRCSASWDPRVRRTQSLPVTGCRQSANPVSGTICRLSCKGRLTGGEVTSYWHHGVESEHTGMEEEINPGSNTRTLLRPLPYRFPRSCTGYCWFGVVQSWDYYKAGRHNKNYKKI